jgi:hypothetical protein
LKAQVVVEKDTPNPVKTIGGILYVSSNKLLLEKK